MKQLGQMEKFISPQRCPSLLANPKLIFFTLLLLFVYTPLCDLPGWGAQGVIEKLDLWDADLFHALEAITRKAGLNLVVASRGELAADRVTVHLRKIAPLAALDALLTVSGYVYEVQDNLLIVSSLPEDHLQSGHKIITQTVWLKHMFPEQLEPLFTATKFPLEHAMLPSQNSILLRGKSSVVRNTAKLIETMDQPLPQIAIESQIIELSESGSQDLGLTWGGQPGSFQFSYDPTTGKTLPTDQLLATLSLLAGTGKAKILAHPKMTVLAGETASIQIGDRIPYAVPSTSSSGAVSWTVQYLDSGLKLKVTPKLNGKKEIWVDVEPEVSSIKEWRTTQAGEFPVLSTRNAKTRALLKEGETFAIGGLLSEAERETITRLPLLGQLPLLGSFFQKSATERAKTDILFLLTPKIITK